MPVAMLLNSFHINKKTVADALYTNINVPKDDIWGFFLVCYWLPVGFFFNLTEKNLGLHHS